MVAKLRMSVKFAVSTRHNSFIKVAVQGQNIFYHAQELLYGIGIVQHCDGLKTRVQGEFPIRQNIRGHDDWQGQTGRVNLSDQLNA